MKPTHALTLIAVLASSVKAVSWIEYTDCGMKCTANTYDDLTKVTYDVHYLWPAVFYHTHDVPDNPDGQTCDFAFPQRDDNCYYIGVTCQGFGFAWDSI